MGWDGMEWNGIGGMIVVWCCGTLPSPPTSTHTPFCVCCVINHRVNVCVVRGGSVHGLHQRAMAILQPASTQHKTLKKRHNSAVCVQLPGKESYCQLLMLVSLFGPDSLFLSVILYNTEESDGFLMNRQKVMIDKRMSGAIWTRK